MTDITSIDLLATIIDQVVADRFGNRAYAFVPVLADSGYWQLGVAVAEESGYYPLNGKEFKRYEDCVDFARGLNRHIGLSADKGAQIIVSTMRRN